MFRKRSEEDFAREIESHLQLEADDLRAEGKTGSEAHRHARASFGNPTQARERFYLRSRIQWLDNLVRDLRYALRGMAISPGFTIAAVLTLALGMGANIAIFTLIDAVLLRTLPVSDPSSLYFVRYAGAKGTGEAPPYPCFERIHDQTKSLASIAAYTGYAVLKVRFGSSSGGNLESATAARVSGDYYRVLGLQPALGRLLAPEDQALNPAVAVISYDYWQARFSGDPVAVGQSFILDGHSFTIVGVTPRSFHGIQPGTQQQITLP
jgi:macrolide transport system ATP-binding/permease protein